MRRCSRRCQCSRKSSLGAEDDILRSAVELQASISVQSGIDSMPATLARQCAQPGRAHNLIRRKKDMCAASMVPRMVLHEAHRHHPFRNLHHLAVSAWVPAYRVPSPVLITGPLISLSPSPLPRGTVRLRAGGDCGECMGMSGVDAFPLDGCQEGRYGAGGRVLVINNSPQLEKVCEVFAR